MSLKPCNECGKEVSSKAKNCPNCGARIKKGFGCLTWIGGFFLLMIIIGLFAPKDNLNTYSNETTVENTVQTNSNSESKTKIYKEGELVHIGYTSYKIWKSWYSNKLSNNEFLNQKPDATYLFVEISVRNDDKEARTIPPFKLIDQNNSEYETSDKGWAIEGSIGVLSSLNPKVQKDGFIVFDVPKGNKYKLELSGGYWSPDTALVELKP